MEEKIINQLNKKIFQLNKSETLFVIDAVENTDFNSDIDVEILIERIAEYLKTNESAIGDVIYELINNN